ncbi:beta-N-acetylhexosaminidase [Neobacillus vireti]|uniref:beta-N-acetylhexosaminidase n=1 Tax=Neobacillus vireti TaxID=220686 RepID=UPI002FFE2382
MFKKFMYILFSIALVISLSACNVQNSDAEKDQIESMTMEEKVGQMLMFGLEEDHLTDKTIKFIQDHHIGGMILFRENINNANQLVQLTNQIKEINSETSKLPIFISVDEEGGLVSRMPPEIKNLPKSAVIGNVNSKKIADQVGVAIGERVGAFGFNMTMAPVLDINSNPNNPVIGERSFGNNEKVVTEMGLAEMKGIQGKNVIPVIKHFPGHGDTDVDSHKGLPVIEHDLDRLTSLEFIPFQKAIEQDADMVMAAHILLPKIDQNYPSSLSREVITGLLKEQIKFKGVVITDDLTMGAILKNYEIGDAAVKAIQAGNDIVLVCHGYENQEKVLRAVLNAVQNGDISEKQINDSVYRILSLKEKYQLNDEPIDAVDINKINESSEKIEQAINNID